MQNSDQIAHSSSYLTCILILIQHGHAIPTLPSDDRRKADKLKRKRRRKEREDQATGEPSAAQQPRSPVPDVQYPLPLGGRTIKEEPEDDITIPLPPPPSQRLPCPSPCKQEAEEEPPCWDERDLEEGVVKVEKVEGFSGNRTVFRQGKQVVFRDEDGSGEDEDIMVDSGKTSTTVAVQSVIIRFSKYNESTGICLGDGGAEIDQQI